MLNERQAAREIEKAYREITGGAPETVSLYAVWYAIEMHDMTIEELAAGAKYLARNSEAILSPAMYPGLFSERELETTVRYGGRDCNTLYIRR